MSVAPNPSSPKLTSTWGSLPPRMRVLFITTASRTGAWLAEALATDSASDVQLEEARGIPAALDRLRDESFDALLVSHESGELDALDLIEGLRAGGAEVPMIVLGAAAADELAALAFEVGADAYLNVHGATIRTMLWTVARAIERHQLIRENRRLRQAERQRLQQEHSEADRMLAQQRALITDLESLCQPEPAPGSESQSVDESELRRTSRASDSASVAAGDADSKGIVTNLPEQLVGHYRELLRAHVIMGSGNLTAEMSTLADLLATAGISARQTMLLHLQVLEELIRGLGSRSARHVMSRADLLALEVMVNLAEGYRRRLVEQISPPRQQWLHGFDANLAEIRGA